ncbi:hypothetical protein FOCC_FOCC011393 [Frankliniella occidentalis]|nr:hypothetical protein FOCC_FOCC011393 [Frankliniella occidentalis]
MKSRMVDKTPVLFSPHTLMPRPHRPGPGGPPGLPPQSLESRLQALEDYSQRTFKPTDAVLQEVVQRARQHNMPNIHVGRMDGLTMEVIIRMAGYKKVHVGRASEVLEQLTELGPFDGIFIDADKNNYPVYLDWAEKNIRVGGAIFGDNTFGFGHVWRNLDTIHDHHLKPAIAGVQTFNSRLADNPNFRATILPTDQGLTMAVRLKMAGYKKMVEVGALAGYSGILIARALGPGGHLHSVEYNPDFAEVAMESFRKAGLDDRVTVHVGRAAEVLEQLTELGPFDGIFIDADKDNYPVYLDWAEKNIRVGGAIFGDNAFGFGHVWRNLDTIHDHHLKSAIAGLQTFNARLANNPNFRATILPTDQGLTMAVRLK